MGSILNVIKKGISALNPIPAVKNNTGYLGDSTKKVIKRNKAIQDAANLTK